MPTSPSASTERPSPETARRTRTPGRPRLRTAGFLLATCAALLTLTAWAVSSPPGSSPDEPYHLASIWCAHGPDAEHCLEGASPEERIVPNQLTVGQCFTGRPVSAACRPAGFDAPMEPDAPTELGNWVGAYPPVYYAVMRAFAQDSYDASVVTMRLVNSAIAVLMVASLVVLLPPRLRRLPGVVMVATAVPVSVFFLASVNPTGWALVSTGTLWLAVYGAFEATGRRRHALVAHAAVATLLGAGARSDAALFAILSIVVALGLRGAHLRRSKGLVATFLALAAGSAALFLSTGHADVVATGFGAGDAESLPPVDLLVGNLLTVPSLVLGNFGLGILSALGWFDTHMPGVVGVGSTLVVAALVWRGWSTTWPLKTAAVALMTGAVFAYPLVMLQTSGLQPGEGFQPRYTLPLVLVLVGISLLPRMARDLALGRAQAMLLTSVLAVAHSIALLLNLTRYTHGATPAAPRWPTSPEWWWGSGPAPIWVWLLGSLAFALLAALTIGALGAERAEHLDTTEAADDRA